MDNNVRIPVLIVGFARSANIEKLAIASISQGREVYIFIDGPTKRFEAENVEARLIAEELKREHGVHILTNDINLGVGLALPTALDWAFQTEIELIILEDDCVPNEFGWKYFDEYIRFVDSKKVILCGTSPYENLENHPLNPVTSQFALISGWATTKKNWEKLRRPIFNKTSVFRIIGRAALSLKSLPTLTFFWSANIRVHKGVLEAWDAPLVFGMMLNGMQGIIPPHTVVENNGLDYVASNTVGEGGNRSTIYKKAINKPIVGEIDVAEKIRTQTDRQITKNIYGVKLRNLVSPIKASLAGGKLNGRSFQIAESN